MKERAPLLALALALAGTACAEAEGPAPHAGSRWPEGTVLLIAGRPVGAGAIDPLAEALLELEPGSSLSHRRRLALLHLAVPLECGRALADEGRRRRAQQEASEFLRAWKGAQIPPEDGGLERVVGNFQTFGIPIWYVARELEVGAWSDVRELPGAYTVVQLLADDRARRGAARQLELLVARFPYIDQPGRIQHEAARAQVVHVHPDWEDAVPGLLRHREGSTIAPGEDATR